jgi:hypothetical protein
MIAFTKRLSDGRSNPAEILSRFVRYEIPVEWNDDDHFDLTSANVAGTSFKRSFSRHKPEASGLRADTKGSTDSLDRSERNLIEEIVAEFHRFDVETFEAFVRAHSQGAHPRVMKGKFLLPSIRVEAAEGSGLESRRIVSAWLPCSLAGIAANTRARPVLHGIDKVYVSRVFEHEPWFLKKDSTLSRCRDAVEEMEVQNAGGIIYYPESRTNGIVVQLHESALFDRVAKSPDSFTMEVLLGDIVLSQPMAWGHYQKEAWLRNGLNTEILWLQWLDNIHAKMPVYFGAHAIDVDPENIPEIAQAEVLCATLKNSSGRHMAYYRKASDYGK